MRATRLRWKSASSIVLFRTEEAAVHGYIRVIDESGEDYALLHGAILPPSHLPQVGRADLCSLPLKSLAV